MRNLINEVKKSAKILYLIVFLVLIYFVIHYGFKQNILLGQSLPTNETLIKNIIYADVIQYNIAYLALSITFIFVIGGAFYIFNIKPIEKKIEDQETKLRNLEDRIDEKILKQQTEYNTKFQEIVTSLSNSKSIEERINYAEIRIQIAEEKAETTQLDILWSQHYIWQNSRSFAGDMLCMIFYLQLIVQFFKKTEQLKDKVEMCLYQIKNILESDPGTEFASVLRLAPNGRTPRDMADQHFGELMALFKEIKNPELEPLKLEIRKLIIEKWYSGTVPVLPSPLSN
ncbi:hypothetical protein IT399_01875 [Candidatus Nomurabacteria bacterium]|nr:hypothetical protein [Candidatus Nomurabacteria bacterium]